MFVHNMISHTSITSGLVVLNLLLVINGLKLQKNNA